MYVSDGKRGYKRETKKRRMFSGSHVHIQQLKYISNFKDIDVDGMTSMLVGLQLVV